MRVFNIVYFIVMLSISTAVVNAILGSGSVSTVDYSINITQQELEDIATSTSVWDQITDMIKLAYEGIKLSFKVIVGVFLLGSTVQSLSPFSLPGELISGLNMLSLIAATTAIAQLIRGIVYAGGE